MFWKITGIFPQQLGLSVLPPYPCSLEVSTHGSAAVCTFSPLSARERALVTEAASGTLWHHEGPFRRQREEHPGGTDVGCQPRLQGIFQDRAGPASHQHENGHSCAAWHRANDFISTLIPTEIQNIFTWENISQFIKLMLME